MLSNVSVKTAAAELVTRTYLRGELKVAAPKTAMSPLAKEIIQRAAFGAVAGGGVGMAFELFDTPGERNFTRAGLTGAALGGAVGAGRGLANHLLRPSTTKTDRWTAPRRDTPHDPWRAPSSPLPDAPSGPLPDAPLGDPRGLPDDFHSPEGWRYTTAKTAADPSWQDVLNVDPSTLARNSLIGAGIGGGAGLISEIMNGRKKKNYTSTGLTGALLGGLGGAGYTAAKPFIDQQISGTTADQAKAHVGELQDQQIAQGKQPQATLGQKLDAGVTALNRGSYTELPNIALGSNPAGVIAGTAGGAAGGEAVSRAWNHYRKNYNLRQLPDEELKKIVGDAGTSAIRKTVGPSFQRSNPFSGKGLMKEVPALQAGSAAALAGAARKLPRGRILRRFLPIGLGAYAGSKLLPGLADPPDVPDVAAPTPGVQDFIDSHQQ